MSGAEQVVLVPFGDNLLALTLDQFAEALERGRSLAPSPVQPEVTRQEADRILDADGMERATGIPASWFAEKARRREIPHLRAGKYVRFRLAETLDAVAARRAITETARATPGRERHRRPQSETARNARGGSSS